MSVEITLRMEPGQDMGPCDRANEGAYRRGFHQAVAELAHALRANPALGQQALADWVEGPGMAWRKDTPLDRKILPPALN